MSPNSSENEKCFRHKWHAIDDNMAHAHFMLDTYGYMHTFRICNACAFPLEQWLNKSASVLSYTYTAYFFKNCLCPTSYLLVHRGPHTLQSILNK